MRQGPDVRWRRRRAVLAMVPPLLFLATGSALALTLAESGEWVVSCDNAASCSLVNASELTQLRVAQPSPFGMSRICIHRQGGPEDAAQFFLTLRSRKPSHHAARQEDRWLRLVGGKVRHPDIALHHRGTEHWEVPSQQVGTLLGGLDETTQLHVITREGAVLERLSVHGIEKALSLVDQAQSRTGTVTALREKGDRSTKTLPVHPKPQSLVTAPLPKLATAPTPSAASLRLRQHACGSPGLDASIGYRLLGDQRRPDRTLWVTPCDPKPGLRRDLFVIEHADGTAAPAAFPGVKPERPTGQPGLLATPRLDAETGLIREQWIAPVPPPKTEACAIQRLWGWNGVAFELAEERRSLSCAGIVSGYWARTYTRPLVMAVPDGSVATAASFHPPC
jgi:Protein of unknown function (DUF1176)